MSEPRFLEGEKVWLRGLAREDLRGPMLRWSDDREVTKYMFRGWRPSNIALLEAEYDRALAGGKDIEFAVMCKKSGVHVGVAGLHEIDWLLTRQAEFRVMIGEKGVWGMGYGQEVAKLLVTYAFDRLNLHRVYLGVNGSDARAVACYEKAGFVREGVLRESVYRNGVYYDAVRMAILRREWKGGV